MKKIILATVATLGFMGQSLAADLPARMPVKAPVAVPYFNWTGFYIGAHVGYGWRENNSTAVTGTAAYPVGFAFPTANASGIIGGGQIGYNYQIQNWVIGIEGDGSAADLNSNTRAFSPLIAGRYSDNHGHTDWIATLTGRLGFAANNWLFYAKGGAAWAGGNSTSETYTGAGVLVANTSFAGTGTGWTVGVGTEYAFSNNWSVKLEYNYIDLGTKTITVTNVNTPAFGGATSLLDRDSETKINLVKLGINYRFNWGGPVVANY